MSLKAPPGSINGDLADELHRRYAMGLAKYGQTLDANPAEISARLQHMKEELLDALCYVEWALRGMARLESAPPPQVLLPGPEAEPQGSR